MNVDLVRRMELTLPKMLSPVPTGILNMQRNVLVQFTACNVRDMQPWSLKALDISSQMT
jgi:hypothetical protein